MPQKLTAFYEFVNTGLGLVNRGTVHGLDLQSFELNRNTGSMEVFEGLTAVSSTRGPPGRRGNPRVNYTKGKIQIIKLK